MNDKTKTSHGDGGVVTKLPAHALGKIFDEYLRARETFSAFHSGHEGFAVLQEEVEELWEAVKNWDTEAIREEAVQVGAMALAMILEVCDG